MAKNYVYSTLTGDNAYAIYNYAPVKLDKNALPVLVRTILIKGGHGIANKHVVTPRGVITEISDEDLKELMNDYHFQQHIGNGFITVETVKEDPEKVAENMEDRDGSAPLTPDKFEPGTSDVDNSYKAKKVKGKL